MSGDNNVAQVPKTQVEEQLDCQAAVIDDLSNLVTQIEQRLATVMRSEPGADEGTGKDGQELVPLASTMRSNTATIQRNMNTLRRVLNTLEL